MIASKWSLHLKFQSIPFILNILLLYHIVESSSSSRRIPTDHYKYDLFSSIASKIEQRLGLEHSPDCSASRRSYLTITCRRNSVETIRQASPPPLCKFWGNWSNLTLLCFFAFGKFEILSVNEKEKNSTQILNGVVKMDCKVLNDAFLSQDEESAGLKGRFGECFRINTNWMRLKNEFLYI